MILSTFGIYLTLMHSYYMLTFARRIALGGRNGERYSLGATSGTWSPRTNLQSRGGFCPQRRPGLYSGRLGADYGPSQAAAELGKTTVLSPDRKLWYSTAMGPRICNAAGRFSSKRIMDSGVNNAT